MDAAAAPAARIKNWRRFMASLPNATRSMVCGSYTRYNRAAMSWRFVSCAALFVTCLLTANIIATKLVVVAGVVLHRRDHHLPDVLHPGRRAHRGVGVRGGPACDLARLRLQCRDGGGDRAGR